jgi:pimeloyl-ACP methyl ester carboxylesterase
MIKAREEMIVANGLRHHVVRWGEGPPVILCHGFLDFAWSWQPTASALAERGLQAIAFDWRGHGESAWVSPGGYYHFPDYIRDLEEVIRVTCDQPPLLVGHSMGGTASALYAGARSGSLHGLVLVEGLGPPDNEAAVARERLVAWLDGLDRIEGAAVRRITDLQDALRRMKVQNPRIPDDLGHFLATHATCPHPDGEGLRWRFDPRHRTTAPIPFRLDAFRSLLEGIELPTLIIAAAQGYRLPDEAARMACIADSRFHEIPDASHMIHWDQPVALATAIAEFSKSLG